MYIRYICKLPLYPRFIHLTFITLTYRHIASPSDRLSHHQTTLTISMYTCILVFRYDQDRDTLLILNALLPKCRYIRIWKSLKTFDFDLDDFVKTQCSLIWSGCVIIHISCPLIKLIPHVHLGFHSHGIVINNWQKKIC